MWPELPLEFLVVGTPVSLQSQNSTARNEWKAVVLQAAEAAIDGGSWAFDEKRLSITLFYFPIAAMQGDVDNIAKLAIDALIPRIYLDDSLIDRVLVQRFYPDDPVVFEAPSEKLLAAMAEKDPVLFINIDEIKHEGVST